MIMLTLLAADGQPIAFILILLMLAVMTWGLGYALWKRRRQRLLRKAQRNRSRNRRRRRRHCCSCC